MDFEDLHQKITSLNPMEENRDSFQKVIYEHTNEYWVPKLIEFFNSVKKQTKNKSYTPFRSPLIYSLEFLIQKIKSKV